MLCPFCYLPGCYISVQSTIVFGTSSTVIFVKMKSKREHGNLFVLKTINVTFSPINLISLAQILFISLIISNTIKKKFP